jgi:hypothetical protein
MVELALILVALYTSAVFADMCNIPKVSISSIAGQKTLPNEPVIFVSAQDRQKSMQEKASRSYLLENYGDTEVTLSSSNTYSHGRYTSTLEEYITTAVDTSSQFANETKYLFGNNYDGIFGTLTDLYLNPPCYYCDVAGAKTIGMGGHASGVSFHFHGPGFSEAILGSKRWFLFPPHLTKAVSSFGPNMTVAQWVDRVYPTLQEARVAREGQTLAADAATVPVPTEGAVPGTSTLATDAAIGIAGLASALAEAGESNLSTALLQELSANLQECVIHPGEILYFPAMWMHATLNLDAYNVFMSVFIDPQLMK